MRDVQLEAIDPTRSRVVQRRAIAQQAKARLDSTLVAQRDPAVQLSCRVGDTSCAGAHAETIDRETVQAAPDSLLRMQQAYGNHFVQRVVDLSRQGDGNDAATPEVEQAIQGARGGGQALDSTVRAQMEPAFGANFGGVRVHTNTEADSLNRALSARAFTTGQDIFFKQGEYNPGSSGGRELLAHELTHVVQQNGDKVQTKLTVGQPGDRYEQEADRVARAIMQREQQPVQKEEERGMVRRQEMPEEEEEEPVQAKAEDGQVQRQPEEEEEEIV